MQAEAEAELADDENVMKLDDAPATAQRLFPGPSNAGTKIIRDHEMLDPAPFVPTEEAKSAPVTSAPRPHRPIAPADAALIQ